MLLNVHILNPFQVTYATAYFLTGVAAPVQEAIDPYELIEAVEILSKLPKDFYENLVSADDLEVNNS